MLLVRPSQFQVRAENDLKEELVDEKFRASAFETDLSDSGSLNDWMEKGSVQKYQVRILQL